MGGGHSCLSTAAEEGGGRFHRDKKQKCSVPPNWYASPVQVHCACANDRVVSVIRMVHWRNLLPWYIFPWQKTT